MTRPSVFSTLNVKVDESKQAAAEAKPVPEKKESGVVKTSTYLPREVHDVLREIAFHERVKVHDLLMEGVDHILKKRRHPSVDELKKQAQS
ncbi:hypothetical protein [Aureimonas psammosilenae]|uniref:hypothetical protein n=1 Tax=Aureimonas psammosilenae TaxID=2495496 RepID=UPI001260A32E|nr:hypothetical protein [Aureimonas psammosilenae]